MHKVAAGLVASKSIRRGVRAAEGAALEMLCTPQAYRGFKSPPLRQNLSESRCVAGVFGIFTQLFIKVLIFLADFRIKRIKSRYKAIIFTILTSNLKWYNIFMW